MASQASAPSATGAPTEGPLLPMETISHILDALVDLTCGTAIRRPVDYNLDGDDADDDEDDDDDDDKGPVAARADLWKVPSDHPVRVMGQVCRSLRSRSKALMWAQVRLVCSFDLLEAFGIYRFVRCIDASILERCATFVYVVRSQYVYSTIDFGMYIDSISMAGGEDYSVDHLDIGSDGRVVLSEAEKSGEGLADEGDIGVLNSVADAWALTRFIFDRLVNVETIWWRAWPRITDNHGEGNSIVEIWKGMPRLRRLHIDQNYEGGESNLGDLWHLTGLEEIYFDVEELSGALPRYPNVEGQPGELIFPEHRDLEGEQWPRTDILWFERAKKLRVLCTTDLGTFQESRFIPFLARLDVHAFEPPFLPWREVDEEELELGRAGAALRPALIDFVEARGLNTHQGQGRFSCSVTAEDVRRVAVADSRLSLISRQIFECAEKVARLFNARLEADGGIVERSKMVEGKPCPFCGILVPGLKSEEGDGEDDDDEDDDEDDE